MKPWQVAGWTEHQDKRVDGRAGNPARLLLTAGQVPEHTQAEALLKVSRLALCWADKGYDSDAFVLSRA